MAIPIYTLTNSTRVSFLNAYYLWSSDMWDCIFLISDTEHFCICLLTICLPSLEKCLFKFAAHFFKFS